MNPQGISAPSSKSLGMRVIISIFVVYHLVVILVLANGSSYLGRFLDPWISPYGNLLGFNVTWNFFAPDPAHTMFIRYRIHFDDSEGEGTRDPIEGYFPPTREKIVYDSSQRRFLYAMRLLILDEKKMKVLLGPFLCRQNPGSSSIHIENILEPISGLDVSSLDHLKPQEQATIMDYTFMCGQPVDEVEL
jgi:hypothetical protein